jgi:hypothetical protein
MRNPHEIIRDLASNSERVRAASLELSARINRFEQLISGLKGRTEALCFKDNFILAVARKGDQWQIQYGEHLSKMTPLVDSSFKTKITAIQMFPDLLIAMELKQKLQE